MNDAFNTDGFLRDDRETSSACCDMPATADPAASISGER